MEEWEYKRLSFANNADNAGGAEVEVLNKAGRDGWELVSSFYSSPYTWHYLKRRRRPEGSGSPYR